MRRLVVWAVLLTAGQVGCVTNAPVDQPPVRRHSPQSPRSRQAVPKMQPAPIHRQPTARKETWYPQRRKTSGRWTTIVIHHSATHRGGAKAFGRYHRERNGWDELGYHFVIGNGTNTPDGMIEVGSRWHKQKHGAHCKTPNNYYNEHGIGICLVGDFTKTRPTPKQRDSLRRLVRFLMDEWNIPLERVTTHHAVNIRTQCPGANFPMAAFKRSLAASMTATRMP